MSAAYLPPAPPQIGEVESDIYLKLVSSMQREINRLSDEDRATRKRGLQRLLDELPWTGKGGSGTKKALKQFVTSILLPALLGVTIDSGKSAEEGGGEGGAVVQAAFTHRGGFATMTDGVEKCRELSLALVKKCLANVTTLSSNAYIAIVQILCKRIISNAGEPSGNYPEVAEELRLQVLDNLLLALNMAHAQFERVQKKKMESAEGGEGYEVPPFETSKYKIAIESLIECLPRALSDAFPQSKRSSAELICLLGRLAPYLTRLHFRPLARGIASNCAHQHSKTRSLSLKALASILCNVTEDFDAVMGKSHPPGADGDGGGAGERSVAEDFYGGLNGAGSSGSGPSLAVSKTGGGISKKIDLTVLFHKLLADQNANVRRELCYLCSAVMKVRYTRYPVQRGAYVTSHAELELCLLLLLLCGDEVAEVREAAFVALEEGSRAWAPALSSLPPTPADDADTHTQTSMLGVATRSVFEFSHSPLGGQETAVEDAEAQLQGLSVSSSGSEEKKKEKEEGYLASSRFVGCHINGLITPLCKGVTDWTAESRLRYLHGLHSTFLIAGPAACMEVAQRCLLALGAPCRDDEPSVRQAAEGCCSMLAAVASSPRALDGAVAGKALLGYLLPRVAGINSTTAVTSRSSSGSNNEKVSGSNSGGGNTASQRGNAIRVLTHVILGLRYRFQEGYCGSLGGGSGGDDGADGALIAKNASPAPFALVTAVPLKGYSIDAHVLPVRQAYSGIVAEVASALMELELHEFREEWLREAVLLLARALIDTFPALCSGPESADTERNLLLALLYLMGRLPGESDLVPSVAAEVLSRLCVVSGQEDKGKEAPPVQAKIKAVFSLHFEPLLLTILTHSASSAAPGAEGGSGTDEQLELGDAIFGTIRWDNDNPSKAAFDQLIRTCPSEAWKQQEQILQVIVPQVQLPGMADEKDAESIAKTYRAVAGETDAFEAKDEANVRLTLMAMLEGWVRAGNQDWTVSKYLNLAAPVLLKGVICRNLVWRVGRVEATVRKVTLATAHALLRAGSVPPQTLYACAAELVPLLCSQLDDNEASMRHMAALSISVVFDRLRGAFGPQAVSEMYPMLVKRFDDSNDDVRECCIKAMGTFMSASLPGAFSGTSLDYTLDQLFVHLDDGNEVIQNACAQALLVAAALPGSPGSGTVVTCKELVARKAKDQRGSHRSPARCDALLRELQ